MNVNRLIERLTRPVYGLLIFATYPELHRWRANNIDALRNSGAVINVTTSEIRFPNGSKLILGHGTSDEDILPYISCEFDFVEGTDHPRLLSRVTPR